MDKIKDYIQELAYNSSKNKESLGDLKEKLVKTRVITGAYDKLIKVWDNETGECVKILEGHIDQVSALISSPTYFISGSKDGSIKFWNLNLKCTKTIDASTRPDCFVYNKKNQFISRNL